MSVSRTAENLTVALLVLFMMCCILLTECSELSPSKYDRKTQLKSARRRFTLNFNYDEYIPSIETTADYWSNIAQNEILKRLGQPEMHLYKAKNVIFFIGDGMPLASLTAARIQKGQMEGKLGEESSLTFERFPNVALSKVT